MAVITAETVRDEVRAWLAENWDPDLTVAEWWERLMRSGLRRADVAGGRLRPGLQPRRSRTS